MRVRFAVVCLAIAAQLKCASARLRPARECFHDRLGEPAGAAGHGDSLHLSGRPPIS